MRRNLDLIRALLLSLENTDQATSVPTVPGFSGQESHYHLTLLVDAGLVEKQSSGYRLTWQGHELLDGARPNDRWQKAKATCESAGGFAIEVLKAVLIDLAKKQAGIG